MENANKEESEKLEDKANEKEKKSLIEIFKSTFYHPVKEFILRIGGVFLRFWNSKVIKYIRKIVKVIYKKIASTAFLTFLLALGTIGMAIYTRKTVKDNQVLINSNNEILELTRKANARQEKLFVGQNKPLIDVTPISITQYETKTGETMTKMALTKLSLVNYSGFTAYNVIIDASYFKNNWISEWLKAKNDQISKEPGVVIGKDFDSVPKSPKPRLVYVIKKKNIKLVIERETFIGKLESGGKGKAIHIGQLDLEGDVGLKPDGHQIWFRITWENENGHVFDEVHEYNLLCTKVEPGGRSFTFIPKGIISQKY